MFWLACSMMQRNNWQLPVKKTEEKDDKTKKWWSMIKKNTHTRAHSERERTKRDVDLINISWSYSHVKSSFLSVVCSFFMSFNILSDTPLTPGTGGTNMHHPSGSTPSLYRRRHYHLPVLMTVRVCRDGTLPRGIRRLLFLLLLI